MGENDRPERARIGASQLRVIWGTGLITASIIFSILLLIILIVGRVGVGMAFAWAGGAALITLIVVAVTGLSFYRLPMKSQRRNTNSSPR